MIKSLIFYAPLGENTPPQRIGGAEAGCLKTLELFKAANYDVKILHKPARNHGVLKYFFEMSKIPFSLISLLRRNENSVLHIAGFYLKLISFEWLLVKIAHSMGHKTIYEVRNGGMIQAYNQGSMCYKYLMKHLLLDSAGVLCQGLDYVDFIERKWGKVANYYPNYILDRYVTANLEVRMNNPIQLIYLGRITESKNIDVIIQTLSNVQSSGLPSELHLIGGYSAEYRGVLDKLVTRLGLNPNSIIFHGRQNFDYINTLLKKSHYFIFPSQEKREGHSNALTEAMGCGVVPIVSNAGFNASICGLPELVVSEIDPKLYAKKIIDIELNDKWSEYSSFVHSRIVTNYTQSVVSERLISYIDKLFY